MTNYELMNSFDYFVNTSIIPNDVSFYDSFNKNTNTTLKTDFMIVIFSTLNEYLLPSFLNNIHPFIFMFTDSVLIYNLLEWCFYYNHPNYFKYIINNIYNLNNEDILKILNNYNGGFIRPYSQTTYLMYQLGQYINILKRYNFTKKFDYEFHN